MLWVYRSGGLAAQPAALNYETTARKVPVSQMVAKQ